jgi:hypothetical protein
VKSAIGKSPSCVAHFPPPQDDILLDVAECHAPVLCSGRLPAARRVYVCACEPRSITYLSFLPSCTVHTPTPQSCLPEHCVPICARLLLGGSCFCLGNFCCSMFSNRLLGISYNFCNGLFVTLFYNRTFLCSLSAYRCLSAIFLENFKVLFPHVYSPLTIIVS